MPTSPLTRLFGHSPILPLQEHMEQTYACVQQLRPFFAATFAEDWQQATKIQKKIARLEGKADKLKHKIRMSLPSELFLPVPRADLLELLTMLDEIANKAKDIVGLVLGRRLTFPTELHQDFMAYLKRCKAATEHARATIQQFDKLLTAGFSSKEGRLVEDLVLNLDAIEDETDTMQVALRKELHRLEKDLPPVDVIFMYKVIELTGGLADQAQRVGHHFELLLAR